MDNHYAYALGYYQGRVVGLFERDDYESWTDNIQLDYKYGYDRGVFDYCNEDVIEQ